MTCKMAVSIEEAHLHVLQDISTQESQLMSWPVPHDSSKAPVNAKCRKLQERNVTLRTGLHAYVLLSQLVFAFHVVCQRA